jgi:hypothetical protein
MVCLSPPLLLPWMPLCNVAMQTTRGSYHSVSTHEPTANLGFYNRFLLKYASRDEVELLGRGNGGIVEIRNNIAQYLEKSPLYGFLRYRRRNVIIKYLPEDCSRLIQGASYRPFPTYSTNAHLASLQHV